MLGSLIVYLKGMRIMMFQLSGYYYKPQTANPALPGEGSAATTPKAWQPKLPSGL